MQTLRPILRATLRAKHRQRMRLATPIRRSAVRVSTMGSVTTL